MFIPFSQTSMSALKTLMAVLKTALTHLEAIFALVDLAIT
jgi:hypothetical protein